ncbi:hypothetical protein C8Q80DRAFT_1274845 [Daedaleopsis nitida]|nr:hypothetical protein C8Q80DRAFT_1274845 [Daedaleopsis nitida]
MRHYKDFVPSGPSTELSQWTSLFPKGTPDQVHSDTSPSPLQSREPSVSGQPEGDDTGYNSTNNDWWTTPDAFGLFRQFCRLPKHDPDTGLTLESTCDAPRLQPQPGSSPPVIVIGKNTTPRPDSVSWLTRTRASSIENTDTASEPSFGPFGNSTTQLRLVDWFYGRESEVLSLEHFDDILDIIHSKGFTPKELEGFTARKSEHLLEAWAEGDKIFHPENGWHESSVHIPMPCMKVTQTSKGEVPTYEVHGLHHRDIIDLVTGCLSDKDSRFAHSYHWIPSKLYWNPPASKPSSASADSTPSPASSSHTEEVEASPSTPSQARPSPPPPSATPPSVTPPHPPLATPPLASPPPPLRVYTDTYNPDAMNVEYAVLPILLWSDETVLSSFGSAKLWPIYLYFGSLSKYIRGRPTGFAAHHLDYIPDLPNSFADYYESIYGKPPSAELNGILLDCGDGIKHHFFLRFFTYSADYMEKVKITASKPNSINMCPHCLTEKNELCEAGTCVDALRRTVLRLDDLATHQHIKRAREMIFKKGFSLSGNRVKALLREHSLTPTQNTFSIRFAQYGVNADMMHEFELGVWRGIFDHLVRLLHTQGDNVVKEFNHRMCLMPEWGRDRIRRFYDGVSTRKRMAAHDYEAYLIVMLPVIEGLLPLEDDRIIMDMLFELANWHALAELRIHHDITLASLERATAHMRNSTYSEGEEFTKGQLNSVRILDDKIYQHKYIRLNYTTYNMRRKQDIIHRRWQADIMVPSPEWDESSPYWFARVIRWQDYDLLWVRWYTSPPPPPSGSAKNSHTEDSSGSDAEAAASGTHLTGFQYRCQPHLQFVDANDPDNDLFSFIDPEDVIRAAYILPCPAGPYPLTDELLKPSPLARQIPVEPGIPDDRWDYEYYTVAMFADRDIFMRHHGGGIGHRSLGVTLEESKANAQRVSLPALPPDLEYLDEDEPMGSPALSQLDNPDSPDVDPGDLDEHAAANTCAADKGSDAEEDLSVNLVDFEMMWDQEDEGHEDIHQDQHDGEFGSDDEDIIDYYDMYAAEGFGAL